MGRDKSLITIDGVPMVARVAAALIGGGCSSVRVIGGQVDEFVALGLQATDDRYPGEGPLGGILTALEGTAADAVLVAACDLPSLSAATVGALVVAARVEPERVVVARSTRLEPLCAVWPRSVIDVVAEVFSSGGRAVAAAFDRVAVREVPVPSGDLRNVNTLDDVAEMQPDRGIA
jgi:molybdopterin-guanine dinucleotide biosynthesis protein A